MVGKRLAEFACPLSYGFMADDDAAGRQHLLHHAQAQWEPKIEPYRIADDLSRVSIAGINWVSRRRHPARLPDQLGSHQACSRPTCRCLREDKPAAEVRRAVPRPNR